MRNILVTKETRANEKRVALIPSDAKRLIAEGYRVIIESQAGDGAGFSDKDYELVGCQIRQLEGEQQAAYENLFANIQLILRVKRPNRAREILENKAIGKGTIMIGALDPLEKNSSHIEEYHQRQLKAYSIDQLILPPDDPMNILAAMSKIAGKLALQDALQKITIPVNSIVIIGFGTVGQAAFFEAVRQGYLPCILASSAKSFDLVKNHKPNTFQINKNSSIEDQRQQILPFLLKADIVVTSARQSNQPAPLLITEAILHKMKSGAVVVDMALSEGGNVENSKHDAALVLGNNILVINTSGYPKAQPQEASQLWSRASLQAVLRMQNKAENKLFHVL